MSLCRKILNTYSSGRLISKQEATVLVAKDLKLSQCSETFEIVPINAYFKIYKTRHQAQQNEQNNFLLIYSNRCDDKNMEFSLDDYFNKIRNNSSDQKQIVPHYVGLSYKPVYPATVSYARGTLIIYKPWNRDNVRYFNVSNEENKNNLLKEFHEFLKSNKCPTTVKLQYQSAKYQFFRDKSTNNILYSPKNPLFPTNTNDDEDEHEDEVLKHFNNLKTLTNATTKNLSGYDFDIGIHYDWNECNYEYKNVSFLCYNH